MRCSKCGSSRVQHIVFCMRCTQCGDIFPLEKGDTTGVDFLVERYTGNNLENQPGQDGVVYTPVVEPDSSKRS